MVLLLAAAGAAVAAPVSLGTVGGTEVFFDAALGLSGVELQVGDVRFQPLAGAGAAGEDGRVDPGIPLDVAVAVDGDVVRIAVSANHRRSCAVEPGHVTGLGEWRRLDLSRYAEPYGQTWWPKTVYSVDGDFWFTAHWVMAESNGTKWRAVDQQNHGDGPFAAALAVDYASNSAGDRLPVRESLEIRVGRDPWAVVPELRQAPSEYRDFLQRAVFVDLWGGNPVPELQHVLQVLGDVAGGRVPFYIILQNWSAGGWDALLPDSMRLPDFPPNPAVGTVAALRALCTQGKQLGRFGFRTNYVFLQKASPSFRMGLVNYGVGPDGASNGWTRCCQWLPTAGRAENEIRDNFQPTASFTDQLTSGGAPWRWHDYAAENGSWSMRSTLDYQRRLARLIKDTHSGPLSSETLIDEPLIGACVDTGDYGIKNGHSRLFSPEYKLRRLHRLSGFHGMGLMYRFYEWPPFKNFHAGLTPFRDDQAMLDDYRACEVLYGNGGYICHNFANWRYYLTECLLIGNLQRHYTRQAVRRVLYESNGEWLTLAQLVEEGAVPTVVAWVPQSPYFGLIRVEYEDGLTVVVNRRETDYRVPEAGRKGVVLPQAGWVAWHPQDGLLAFSAYWPDTRHRIDYLDDPEAGIRFVDPRGSPVDGVEQMTLRDHGRTVMAADIEAGTYTVNGLTRALDLPIPPPVTRRSFEFDNGTEGWRPVRGILSQTVRDGCLELNIGASDVYLRSPLLSWPGDEIDALEIRMSVTAAGAKGDGVFFTTSKWRNTAADKRIGFAVNADGKFHTYRVPMATHPKWRGQTITGLRLDPIQGALRGTVRIDYIHAVSE